MPKITVNGASHYYEIHGSGPNLLLVAGMGGTANYWQGQVPVFAQTNRVIVYDQRGTGRSAHVPVASIGQLAEDAVGLLDALDIASVDYVGHSTGGNIGQTIALNRPERLRRMVIYASTTHGDAYRAKVWRVRRAILDQLGPELYGDMTSLMLYPPWWIAEHAEELEAQQAAQTAMIAPAEVMTSRIEAVQAFDLRDRLGNIATPTLVVVARDDIQTPPYFSESLARLIPGARLVMLDRGGHAVSRTLPDDFNAVVADFLAP